MTLVLGMLLGFQGYDDMFKNHNPALYGNSSAGCRTVRRRSRRSASVCRWGYYFGAGAGAAALSTATFLPALAAFSGLSPALAPAAATGSAGTSLNSWAGVACHDF